MPRDSHESGHIRPNRASRDRELVVLAAQQHGVVAWRQLREVGFTREMVRRRLEAGRLYRPQPDVYLLPSLNAAWDLGSWPTGTVDVSVTRNRRPRRGVRIHVVEGLALVERDGFQVTTPMRTLIDIAGSEPRAEAPDQ